MNTIKKLLFASMSFIAWSATAQTAEEIAAKNVEAMGGAAKLATLTSYKKSGNMSSNGTDFPITMTATHQKGFRMDFEIMGTSNYQLTNAEKGFVFMPIAGMQAPKEMDADQQKSMLRQADLQGSFLNYKEKETTLALVSSSEKVDGTEAYNLKVTFKEGKDVTYFLDKKTNRIIKTITKAKGPDGNEMEIETSYSDYKQNADGYWFAYTMTTSNGPISFDKIETNIKVDESIFKP